MEIDPCGYPSQSSRREPHSLFPPSNWYTLEYNVSSNTYSSRAPPQTIYQISNSPFPTHEPPVGFLRPSSKDCPHPSCTSKSFNLVMPYSFQLRISRLNPPALKVAFPLPTSPNGTSFSLCLFDVFTCYTSSMVNDDLLRDLPY